MRFTKDHAFMLAYQGPTTFWRAPYTRDAAGADIVAYGVPLDITTTNRPGARLGPRAIREASTFTGVHGQIWPHDFDFKEKFVIRDYGDMAFQPPYIEHLLEVMETELGVILAAGASPLGLGGDHFMAYPELKALSRLHGELSLIQFDAHRDTMDVDGFSHASVFRRAAAEGLIDPTRSVQVGIRTGGDDGLGFHVVYADNCARMGGQEIAEYIKDIVGDRRCFISLDVDGMDPAYTPGTGTPVPGGLTSAAQREILWNLKGVRAVGADVVEVAPPYDPTGVTAITAAVVAHDLAYILAMARRTVAGSAPV